MKEVFSLVVKHTSYMGFYKLQLKKDGYGVTIGELLARAYDVPGRRCCVSKGLLKPLA